MLVLCVNFISIDDLETAENKYTEAKRELDSTLLELEDI